MPRARYVCLVRVLTVYFRPQRGGLMGRLSHLVGALLASGDEVIALSAEPLGLAPHARLENRTLSGDGVPVRTGLGFWAGFTVRAPLAIAAALGERRTDAVVVFDPYYAWLAAPACRLRGVPLVLFARALPWLARPMSGLPSWLRPLVDATDRMGLARADRVVALSNAMRDALVERVPSLAGRASVLPNALPRAAPPERATARAELGTDLGWPPDACVVVTSGVLTARKDLTTLLEAFEATRDDRLRLLVVGDGPERAALQARATALGASDRIAWLGWREHPAEVVCASDLFVLPSVHEGMSNSLLEALGMGLPVLAADTPEHREMLPATELRFPPRDAAALARRLDAFARDPAERERLGAAAAEAARALDFDWDARVVAEIRAAIPWFVDPAGAH